MRLKIMSSKDGENEQRKKKYVLSYKNEKLV